MEKIELESPVEEKRKRTIHLTSPFLLCPLSCHCFPQLPSWKSAAVEARMCRDQSSARPSITGEDSEWANGSEDEGTSFFSALTTMNLETQ